MTAPRATAAAAAKRRPAASRTTRERWRRPAMRRLPGLPGGRRRIDREDRVMRRRSPAEARVIRGEGAA